MNALKVLQHSVEATKVEYRRLGSSGLKVSFPILGAMSIGNPAWGPWILQEAQSLDLLKAAYDRGLNTWDTANVYSNGISESIIGKALRKYDIPRSKVVILSKCGGAVGEQPGLRTHAYKKDINASKDYVNQKGLSRGAIFSAVEASLTRLQTPYIDVLQIHRFDPETPIEETMEALHDLVKAGKVRYLGASSMWATQFAMMQFAAEQHGWTKFISMQNHYNLLYREEEREMIKFCNKTGVGLIPASDTLAIQWTTVRSSQGNGNPRFKTGHSQVDKDIIERVEELAQKKGWKMSQINLAWLSKRVTSPIVGLNSIERMEEVLAVKGQSLTDEEDMYLGEPYKTIPVDGHV
ncbi:hypothetical protein MMC25_000501 [Agyrium rufum]|nr:hypothetical protein [Agyrium rufum]